MILLVVGIKGVDRRDIPALLVIFSVLFVIGFYIKKQQNKKQKDIEKVKKQIQGQIRGLLRAKYVAAGMKEKENINNHLDGLKKDIEKEIKKAKIAETIPFSEVQAIAASIAEEVFKKDKQFNPPQ